MHLFLLLPSSFLSVHGRCTHTVTATIFLLALLALLQRNLLAGVPDALTAVRLRGTKVTEACAESANRFLVNSGDNNLGILLHGDSDALRDSDIHWVGKTQREIELLALHSGTVTDTNKGHRLGEALRHTDHHVVREGASETVEGLSLLAIGHTVADEVLAIDGERDLAAHVAIKLTLRTLHEMMESTTIQLEQVTIGTMSQKMETTGLPPSKGAPQISRI